MTRALLQVISISARQDGEYLKTLVASTESEGTAACEVLLQENHFRLRTESLFAPIMANQLFNVLKTKRHVVDKVVCQDLRIIHRSLTTLPQGHVLIPIAPRIYEANQALLVIQFSYKYENTSIQNMPALHLYTSAMVLNL